jgi:hypothetical protein
VFKAYGLRLSSPHSSRRLRLNVTHPLLMTVQGASLPLCWLHKGKVTCELTLLVLKNVRSAFPNDCGLLFPALMPLHGQLGRFKKSCHPPLALCADHSREKELPGASANSGLYALSQTSLHIEILSDGASIVLFEYYNPIEGQKGEKLLTSLGRCSRLSRST